MNLFHNVLLFCEIIFAQIGANLFGNGYDCIGNPTNWLANSLNQYSQFTHNLDGNLTNDCIFTYSYDAANRLSSVSSNGVVLVANQYDYKGRRIRKTTPTTETTFVYDGWNLIHETVATISGATTNTIEIQYFWGMDLSETLQGAGGVGGLLAVSCNNNFYFPAYDNNGNITKYIDENGSIVAAYEYDDFGRLISSSGPMSDFFRHRFSTKYFDPETCLYYYGYRFYSPSLMRWLNRDPIEEEGGLNLYVFCCNNALGHHDKLGNAAALTWMSRRPVNGWHFSPVVWNEPSESLDFIVSYTMSEIERKCCHAVTVDRYVRKILGIGNRFGAYDIDHAAGGGMTDNINPYVGYAEGDSPDGQTLFIYRLPWTQSFKWEARCTSGPNKGKILSTIERKFKTSGHWLWNPKRNGRFL